MRLTVHARLVSKGWRSQVVLRDDNPRVAPHLTECRHAHKAEEYALRCARFTAASRYPGVPIVNEEV